MRHQLADLHDLWYRRERERRGGQRGYGAARYGNMACLAYAYEQGAPWDYNTPYVSVEYGHKECLRYALIRGCTWRQPVYTRVEAEVFERLAATATAFEAAAAKIVRAWRRHRDARRRRAAWAIEDAWLHCCYTPGGVGYKRVRAAFESSL